MIALGMLFLKLLLLTLCGVWIFYIIRRHWFYRDVPLWQWFTLLFFCTAVGLFSSWEYSLRPLMQTDQSVDTPERKLSQPVVDKTISPTLEEKAQKLLEKAEQDRQKHLKN